MPYSLFGERNNFSVYPYLNIRSVHDLCFSFLLFKEKNILNAS